MARGLVAMFWYGAQTYAASTAVALLITAVTGNQCEVMFLGMTGVMWVSFIFVSLFQIYLFWQGIDLIKRFLNFAGPAVYVVMIVLMIAIWAKAGGGLLSEVGSIFPVVTGQASLKGLVQSVPLLLSFRSWLDISPRWSSILAILRVL
jgi:NCS1 family nucleobase:cation symporter-1